MHSLATKFYSSQPLFFYSVYVNPKTGIIILCLAMLMILLPNERDSKGWGLELGFLEDRDQLELQSGSEHRTTGSQEEQHEQEDDERE